MFPIVETRGLTKCFKQFTAVSDLSFTIGRGEIYGFLGQNGAGKSTVMRMLTGLITPSSGDILMGGERFSNRRRHLLARTSAIIERPDLYGYLSGWDNLSIFSTLNTEPATQSRLWEVLEIVGLRGREKDKVKAYSQGMKQRLAIAVALVSKPDLLILDEPTNGLDPQGIADMRHLIVSLNRDHGTTILISSHLLHEVQQLATHMIILHKGRKIVEGALNELLNPNETLVDVDIDVTPALHTLLSGSAWGQAMHQATNSRMTFKLHPSRVADLNRWLVSEGVAVHGIHSQHSLEAYFLSLTDATIAKNRTV